MLAERADQETDTSGYSFNFAAVFPSFNAKIDGGSGAGGGIYVPPATGGGSANKKI